jgi:hypothetical protein
MKISRGTLDIVETAKISILKDLKRLGKGFLGFFVGIGDVIYCLIRHRIISWVCLFFAVVFLVPAECAEHGGHPTNISSAIVCLLLAYWFYKLPDIVKYFGWRR